MIEFALIGSFLIAFGIGSNDASNALGICIGSGILKFKKAIFLFGILVFLGILLNGEKVMKTVGKDLVETSTLTIIFSLTISTFLILASNLKKIPLSTHQVIIGSLIGSGLANHMKVNWEAFLKVILSWIISPLIATFISFGLYLFLERVLSKLPFLKLEKLLKIFLIVSAGLISYNTGANELATVLGPVIHAGIPLNLPLIFATASFMVFLGAFLLSYRVIETIGKGITSLDPFSGFVAQLGAGVCIFLFTLLGMPISTTYCIVGAISGVGLTKGLKTVRLSLIKKIIFNWFLAPLSAFLISYLFSLFFLKIFFIQS